MKKIDVTLRGVVSSGLKSIGEKLSTFKMFVTEAEANGVKKQYVSPTLISIHVRDFRDMTAEDMYALLIIGTEVKVHVCGEPGSLEVKVESVIGKTRSTLEDFVIALDDEAAKA